MCRGGGRREKKRGEAKEMVGGDGGKGASLIQTRKWMCSVERPDTPTFSHVYAHKDP